MCSASTFISYQSVEQFQLNEHQWSSRFRIFSSHSIIDPNRSHLCFDSLKRESNLFSRSFHCLNYWWEMSNNFHLKQLDCSVLRILSVVCFPRNSMRVKEEKNASMQNEVRERNNVRGMRKKFISIWCWMTNDWK